MADLRCDVTELLVDQCACPQHRGGRTPQEEADADALHDPSGRWITAQYPGRCGGCWEWFQVGARIRALPAVSGSPWVAECCAEEADRG